MTNLTDIHSIFADASKEFPALHRNAALTYPLHHRHHPVPIVLAGKVYAPSDGSTVP